MRLAVGRHGDDVVKEERASPSLIELVPEHQGIADAMSTGKRVRALPREAHVVLGECDERASHPFAVGVNETGTQAALFGVPGRDQHRHAHPRRQPDVALYGRD